MILTASKSAAWNFPAQIAARGARLSILENRHPPDNDFDGIEIVVFEGCW
jgi:hypothetical protein